MLKTHKTLFDKKWTRQYLNNSNKRLEYIAAFAKIESIIKIEVVARSIVTPLLSIYCLLSSFIKSLIFSNFNLILCLYPYLFNAF